ncbi:MAG: thiamine pyrophosphate-dependent enzyme [Chitinophagales bacterium]|nr:tungsten formylmethanofuran dehydrogenase [Bacteroidota bacterium]MCB9044063.1 tungsten formylmethanofuran dehydrogenase [Chitinophagales bacterium]
MTASKTNISPQILLKTYQYLFSAKYLTEKYEQNFKLVSKYVHATSRGHEIIQIAVGMQLQHYDYVYPYYRDDAMLLSIGCTPYELMLQLFAKKDDIFSGGRTYYGHPSLNDPHKPKIPHQSSATGMQAIPASGAALGMRFKDIFKLGDNVKYKPIVVCSLGDASVTEGEVAEAFQMAVLKKLPIIYLVQDNGWDISANAAEIRAMNAAEYAKGFKGMKVWSIDGTDFPTSYQTVAEAIQYTRQRKGPVLLHANVPLLNHHTSGVRKEWYRDDLEEQIKRDPFPLFVNCLLANGITKKELQIIDNQCIKQIDEDFEKAKNAEDPKPEDLFLHDYAPTEITQEKGKRVGKDKKTKVMVDCALFGIEELMRQHPECLLYGQDVGRRLGGVFREAATLAEKFGDERVFNTPIQEAFIIGSTVGMSAVGLKPIVEVQFADYIWPGLNQLFTELSRAHYLTNGKWTASCVIRVPIGAYGSGGPYHSSSVESVVSNIRGVKIAYPSCGADLKGLLKAAYYDPNPVVIFEHKGLYWSKIKGTENAQNIEPDEDYIVPLGKGRVVQTVDNEILAKENVVLVVTYGMGVHWALNASKKFPRRVGIFDLRSLNPLDTTSIFALVKQYNRCLIVTEEPVQNSFAQALAGNIQGNCFRNLDAPVQVIGSENLPAIPLNSVLEARIIPSIEKVATAIENLLNW